MVDSKKILKKDRFAVNQLILKKREKAGFFNLKTMSEGKTKGQIEDIISKEVAKFYVATLGVGPRESRCYIIEDMIIVRLKGKLLPIEQKILAMMGGKQAIELVKNIRKALHTITTKRLCEMICQITGHKVISSHSDISTKTGERLEVFVLDIDYEKTLKQSIS